MDQPVTIPKIASVESVQSLTWKVKQVTFRLKSPVNMSFAAGQYVIFLLDPKTRRTLSISSDPHVANTFDVCADISPNGPGSQWLCHLRVGDEVTFLGPMGKFLVDYSVSRHKVFIATGTGIAPIRSMIYENLNSRSPKPDIKLYWGLRYKSDVFWDEEFKKLAAEHKNFKYILTLSRPEGTPEALKVDPRLHTDDKGAWTGLRGRVTDHIDLSHEPEQTDFYLCGGREITSSIKTWLTGKGVPEERIRTELFF